MELLVVIGILLVLVSIFVPYLMKIRETDHRAKCADNLRAIGGALGQYARTNGGFYPRVVFDPSKPGYTSFTGADAVDPFAKKGGVRANDVTASLWLLVRLNLTEPKTFICPSTGDTADALDDATGNLVSVEKRGNFRSAASLSYSYASPFSNAPGYRLNDTQRSGFKVLGDKNPGSAGPKSDAAGPSVNAQPLELSIANSNNHEKAGQNVLFSDGHVEFVLTPYCGEERDNIYTALAAVPLESEQAISKSANGVVSPTAGPAWASDSYLVPTAAEEQTPPTIRLPATTQSAQSTTEPATTQLFVITASSSQPATNPVANPPVIPPSAPTSRPATQSSQH